MNIKDKQVLNMANMSNMFFKIVKFQISSTSFNEPHAYRLQNGFFDLLSAP